MANLRNRLDSKQTLQIVLAGVPIELAQVDLSVYNSDQIRLLYLCWSSFKHELVFILDIHPDYWRKQSTIIRILRHKNKRSQERQKIKVNYAIDASGLLERRALIEKHIKIFNTVTGTQAGVKCRV